MTDRSRAVWALAGLGVVCVAASMTLYALLHLRPPSGDLDWTRRTISQYALLSNGWVFDAATLLLAAGSLAVLAALRCAGLVRWNAALALLLWVAGLVGVVSLLCFTPILWAVLSEPWTGVRWWRAIPLGGVERLLGLVEVATVVLLAWWAVRATRQPSNVRAVSAMPSGDMP